MMAHGKGLAGTRGSGEHKQPAIVDGAPRPLVVVRHPALPDPRRPLKQLVDLCGKHIVALQPEMMVRNGLHDRTMRVMSFQHFLTLPCSRRNNRSMADWNRPPIPSPPCRPLALLRPVLPPFPAVQDQGTGDHLPCSRPADRKSTRLNSSHVKISYAVFCL